MKIRGNMQKNHRKVIYLLILFYSVGVAGLSIAQTQPVFQLLVPWTLLGSFVILLLMDENPSMRKWIAGAILYFLSFFIEAVGVNSGLLFGEYQYGEVLGLKAFGTPLMIGINWLILLYCAWEITGRWNLPGIMRIITASGMMVLYDIVLEPSAIALGMWEWAGVEVPLQNYLAWFLYSLLAFTIIYLFRIRINNKIAPALLIIQMMFFLTLNIIRFIWAY